jgi:hypothetical protein
MHSSSAEKRSCVTIQHSVGVDEVGRGRLDINYEEEEMRNVMRKTLVTAGIAVALVVGPGVGMANAAPTQLIPPVPEVPVALPELPLSAPADLATPLLEGVLGLLAI